MRKFLLLSCVLIVLKVDAQDTLKYTVDTYFYQPAEQNINSLQVSLVNQDIVQGLLSTVSSSTKIGLRQSTDIDFFDFATKIDQGDSIAYYLHILGIETSCVAADIDFNIIDKAYIQMLYVNGQVLRTFTCEYNKGGYDKVFSGWPFYPYGENEFVIKMITPKKIINRNKINIRKLEYCISSLESKSDSKNNLVSNASTSVYSCGNIACLSDFNNWPMEWRSTFRIKSRFIVGTTTYYPEASGFLLNTDNNYNLDYAEPPFALTCYHFLDIALKNGFSIEDVLAGTYSANPSTSIEFEWYKACGGTDRYLQDIHPGFIVLEKGNWTTDTDLDEDYIFMRFRDGFGINFVEKESLGLAGWRRDLETSTDYMELGGPTFIFHYPLNMKACYAKDNHSPTIPSTDLIRIGIDEGFILDGSSGSPVFSKDHKVIGMQLAKQGDRDCTSSSSQIVQALSFSAVYRKANLDQYLGKDLQAYSFNPSFDFMPEHCTDCEENADKGEVGTDCGGPCKPCRPYDAVDIDLSEFKDGFEPYNAVATNNILIKGENGLISLKKGSNYTAGNQIIISNASIPTDVTFNPKVNVDPIVVVREPDVLCNLIVPNYMYWGGTYEVHGANIKKVEFSLIDIVANKVIYESVSDSYFDGWIQLWDSKENNFGYWEQNMDLYYAMYIYDTAGNVTTKKSFFHIFCTSPDFDTGSPKIKKLG